MVRPARSLSLAAGLLAMFAGATAAQAPKSAASPLTGLDAYMQEALTKLRGVGFAIAVVKNDSIVYAKGFGVKKAGTTDPVTPRTLFAVGSTSKAFTTTALGMLVDEGRFGWDTHVTDLMKGFELADPAVTRELTVRDLVTHRSGLSRGDLLWMGSRYSRAEVIRRVRYHQPSWSLRTTFGYQNIMYLTAGELIPATTGRSWDDFLKDRIFTPLGMTSTNTSIRALANAPDVATPHQVLDGKLTPIDYRLIDNIGPAGSINSSVLDMAQWVRFHLNGGTVGGKELLAPATHREMFTTQMWMRPEGSQLLYPGTHFLGYGLGWFLSDAAGRKIVEHSGGIDGMVTELILVPEEKLGVVVLSNNSSSLLAFPVAREVVNRYLGVASVPLQVSAAYLQAGDSVQRAQEDSVNRARAVGKGPSLPLEGYTGVYDNRMFGPGRVTLEGGKLVVSIDMRDPIDLEHWHYDTFRGASRDRRLGKTWVIFRLDQSGRAASFTVDGIEQEFVRRPADVAAIACDPTDADRTRLATRPSPYDSTMITVGGKSARLCYSRPSARGRVVYGNVVPYDQLWRLGANDPTIIHLPFDATLAGQKLAAGAYSLYAVPGRDRWTLVINKSISQWGSTVDEGDFKSAYTDQVKAQEVARIPLPVETLGSAVEQLTIRSVPTGANAADLLIEWEKTRVRIPLSGGR